jgi:hypothetical protein
MRAGLIAAALLASPVAGQTPAPAPDYTQDANWLCRPGRADACGGDIGVTNITANGKAELLAPVADTPAPIDCFYVYPTVSTDPGGNSDMIIDPAETNVAKVQFAPFRNICRTFAPMYRQVTLKALRDRMTGQPTTADRVMAYTDVVAAWNDYLARDNAGRGVILIGHSQGSGVLKALLQNEIEGKPVARQIIAAYLPGNNVLVPAGKDVGGDFKTMPLCRGSEQTGCVVAWVSFRDGKAPPADSLFGRSATAGTEVACVNPAAPAGGPAPLSALLPTRSAIVDNASAQPPWATGVTVATPFVALPGLLSGTCQSVAGANVLSIATRADPSDPRTDRIGGDVVVGGQLLEGWGLHLIDVNAVLGDLVMLGREQGKAWRSGR